MARSEYRPDCGYAWVVVAACFGINAIMSGLARAAGVLYIAVIDTYGVSREVATNPFSVRFCVRNLSGPAVGALGQRFGIRPVVLLGGLICGLGGILSALAPDVTWITVAWGGIHGLGYGMSNLIHLIVVNQYFHKYKGLALGISLSGDCLGTFLLPLLMEFLLPIYDLSGTFLILAGISLNVVPAAMLLVSPPWERKDTPSSIVLQREMAPIRHNNKTYEQGITNEGFDNTSEDFLKVRLNNRQNVFPTITETELKTNQDCFRRANSENREVEKPEVESAESIKQLHMQSSEFGFNVRNKNHFLSDDILNNGFNLGGSASLRITNSDIKKKRFRFNINPFQGNRRRSKLSILSCPSYVINPTSDSLQRDLVNMSIPNLCSICFQSIKTIPDQFHEKQNSSQNEKDSCCVGNESLSLRKCSLCSNELEPYPSVSIINLPSSGEEILVYTNLIEPSSIVEDKIIDDYASDKASVENAPTNFLKTNIKPIFLIICATLAFYVFLFISVFTIIIDYVIDNDIPSEYGKYLIIAFSVTDLFGRIGLGVVLDKKWIALSHFAGLTTGLMGLFMLVIPFYTCFTFWMMSFSLCGFVQGGAAIMFPILVDHYMEKNEETVALGSLNFYGGLLMLPIPAMIGYFRDNIGSYDGVFWTVGGLCIFAGCLWLLEPYLSYKRDKHPEKASFTEEKLNNQLYI